MNGYDTSAMGYQGNRADIQRAGSAPAPTLVGVHDSISEQSGQIKELHQLATQIEERLITVLRPDQTISGEATGNAPEATQVTRRIQDNTSALRGLSMRLQSLLQRIEL